MTGLIAALGDNGLGGRGVAGSTKILAVRASRDTEGRFFLSDMLRGIDIAIRAKARVVNLSLAGTSFSRSQARALEAAFFNDVLPVAAAGNHGDSGNPLEFPAALIGGLRGGRGIGLSVGATMPNGQAAGFSTHNRFVSLAAPGASAGDCRFGVFSTLPGHDRRALDDRGRLRRDAGRHRRRRTTPTARARASRRRSSRGSRRSPGRPSPGSRPSRWVRC